MLSINQVYPDYPSYQKQDKKTKHNPNSPLRLFDCLGLTTPVFFFAGGADLGVVVGFRFGGGGGGGAGAGGCDIEVDAMTGELRNADGDGIVIVSISRMSCVQPLTLLSLSRHFLFL